MNVRDFMDDQDPYIYLQAPVDLSFQGIRIYKIANTLAYRVQREDTTHPYGKAYMLDVEEMFTDFMSDDISQEKAGKKVMKTVANELKQFFEKSHEAEQEMERSSFDQKGDPLGRTMIKTTGTDYANQVQNWTHGTTSK
jgi:hypothetical protein